MHSLQIGHDHCPIEGLLNLLITIKGYVPLRAHRIESAEIFKNQCMFYLTPQQFYEMHSL